MSASEIGKPMTSSLRFRIASANPDALFCELAGKPDGAMDASMTPATIDCAFCGFHEPTLRIMQCGHRAYENICELCLRDFADARHQEEEQNAADQK
jgi:hypothetical protein